MNNEDYQLEEMENSAVNKSSMAKRAAMGAGLLATGAATAYGAEQLIGDDEPAVEPTTVEQPDLTSGATAGAVEEGVAEQPQPEPEPQTVHTEETVHVYVHPDPQPQPEPEPEIEFESTTHLYDEEGNLVGTMDTGTLDGKDFIVLDGDADGHGDQLWYDHNGDGKIQDNEVADISDGNYAMGSHGGVHRDVNIETGEEMAYVHENDGHTNPIADIHNDFQDEKSGEEYTDDLAQNNPDYNNDGNVDQYRAGNETSDEEPVLEEEPINGMSDEPLLAEDDALLEEDSTEEYALSGEEPTDDTASEDLAYEDGGEIENDIDDTAEEYLAYNDDAESDYDDSVDDTDQYDIV